FTVEGNAVVTATTGNLNSNQSAATGNTINLNGGRLNVNTMTKPNGSATSTTTLNLNGGVLASSATGVLIPAAIAPIGGVVGAIVDGVKLIDINVNNDCPIAPGDLATQRTLNVNGNVLLAAGGRMEASVSGGGTGTDLLNVIGNLNLSAASNVLKIQPDFGP